MEEILIVTNGVNLNVFGCDMSFPLHHKEQVEGAKIPKVNSQMQSGKLITAKDFKS